MNYGFLKDLLDLASQFESAQKDSSDIDGFKKWIANQTDKPEPSAPATSEPDWEGKQNGRGPDSVICTLLVHLNRYARTYSKAAMLGSEFSTQDEFIYLINLKAFGPMTKTQLIKKNIQDKPSGMLVINRLLQQGWVIQDASG